LGKRFIAKIHEVIENLRRKVRAKLPALLRDKSALKML